MIRASDGRLRFVEAGEQLLDAALLLRTQLNGGKRIGHELRHRGRLRWSHRGSVGFVGLRGRRARLCCSMPAHEALRQAERAEQ